MRWTIAALMAPIDSVKAIVRPSIVRVADHGHWRCRRAGRGNRLEHGGCGSTGQDQRVDRDRHGAEPDGGHDECVAPSRWRCTATIVGWKMVEANPATKVRVVIALVARAPNCLISTTWAGS